MQITLAARSKTSTVFAHSNTKIVGSNPTQSIMSAFIVFLLSCVGSGLAKG
jgi:hypothetical protein